MTTENSASEDVPPTGNSHVNNNHSSHNGTLPLAPPPPASPRSPRAMMPPPPPGSPFYNNNTSNARLRSRSMDQNLTLPVGSGAHSPPPHPHVRLPRSVPVSPVTGRPLSSSFHNHGGMMMGQPHPGGGVPPPFFPMAASPLPHPPEPSERQKIMEAAVAAERLRAKELEPKEAQMTADELRAVLKQERRRTAKICADLAAFRRTAVELQSEAEVVEEGRINALMKRLDSLQQEKGRIIVELEQEEEMLTNTLQKQLNEVRREKAALQLQIDKEKKSNSTMESHLSSLKESNLSAAIMGGVPEEEEEEEEEDDDDKDEEHGHKKEEMKGDERDGSTPIAAEEEGSG